jgi:hypothetical protein
MKCIPLLQKRVIAYINLLPFKFDALPNFLDVTGFNTFFVRPVSEKLTVFPGKSQIAMQLYYP